MLITEIKVQEKEDIQFSITILNTLMITILIHLMIIVTILRNEACSMITT